MNQETNPQGEWVRAALSRYEAPLIRYATRVTQDVEVARDVVQDTFLRLCQADRRKVDGHLAPWLYRVCRNRALDVMKKERRMEPMDTTVAELTPSPNPTPRHAAEHQEMEAQVLGVIERLPAKQQEVFRLKFQEQLSYKEISEVTGYPVNNVRYLLHRSMNTLRERLRGRLDPAPEL